MCTIYILVNTASKSNQSLKKCKNYKTYLCFLDLPDHIVEGSLDKFFKKSFAVSLKDEGCSLNIVPLGGVLVPSMLVVNSMMLGEVKDIVGRI